MQDGYDDQLTREANRWSAQAEARQVIRSWTQSSVVQQWIQRRITGDASCSWLNWVDTQYLSRTTRQLGLSLGCNDGLFERRVVTAGLCHQMEGIDISAQAVQCANEEASRQNISARFIAGDVNSVELLPERYDVVFAVMAMHHFASLEHVLSQINLSLKPTGLLVLNEYVGASRFQWPEHQLALANEVLHLLPQHRRLLRDGSVREVIVAPDLAEMHRTDPFEAIRSAEIVPLVDKYLDVVRRRDYGGSILHLVLHDIIHNFDEGVQSDRELLDMLCGIEDVAVRWGLVNSDFSVIVARKRSSPVTGLGCADRHLLENLEASPGGAEFTDGSESDSRTLDNSLGPSQCSLQAADERGSSGTSLVEERADQLADEARELDAALEHVSLLQDQLRARDREVDELVKLLRAVEAGKVIRLLNWFQRQRRGLSF